MSRRFVLCATVALCGLGLGAAAGGCELVVGDGSYYVDAGAGSSGSGSSGTGSSGSSSSGSTSSGNVSSGTTSSGNVSSGAISSGAGSTGASSGLSTLLNSACVMCEQQECGNEWTACTGSAACVSFLNCEAACGTQACTCEKQFPSGAALWLALYTCATSTSDCAPPCAAAGVGDPCMNDIDCAGADTSCSAWCTELCAKSSDCAGMSLGGQNVFGQNNYCLLNATNVNSCFPACTTNADCQAFAGTDCESATTVENTNVNICTLPADAGTN